MKHFVLLHNQIMMANASIMNSVEQWSPVEVEEVKYQLKLTIENYHTNGDLTDYQRDKLTALVEGIEPTNR